MNITADVLVVGAGIAGWTAALLAEQNGAKVVLIDKSPNGLGDGNTLMTSGSFNTAGKKPRCNPVELYEAVMAEGVAYPDLARAWANNCSRAVDWLKSCRISIAESNVGSLRLEPETEISLAPVYRKDVGRNILTKLKGRFQESGGSYSSEVEGIRLIRESGRIGGVVGRKGEEAVEFRSKSTVLTTGGFSANKEMVRKYIGHGAVECKLRGSKSCTGDGLRMALEVGAKAVNLKYFYGHLLSLKALTDDRFWPYPRLDSLVAEGILIDRNGNRFVDEGRGDVAVANELARRDDVTGSSLIFDQQAWDNAGGDAQAIFPHTPPANPWLMENDGCLYARETVQQLADALGIDRSHLARTLESFNQAAERESFAGFPIPRTGKTRPLRALLYGLKVVPGITFTMGGVLINGRAQVLNSSDEPIPGLYAAGDAIGGLMGGYRGGYTGGLAQAIVTGILAGESAAGFVKKP